MDIARGNLGKEGNLAMYQSHWGLRDTPFRTNLDPAAFYPSPGHDEALARLHFLVDQQRRLGLLLGTSGSGKSLLLEIFADQLRRSGRAVAKTSLLGLQTDEWLWRLTADLGCMPDPASTIGRLWRMLCDRLAEHGYQQRDTVILLDDADRADRQLVTQVARLVRLAAMPSSRLTVVLAGREAKISQLGDDLLDLVDLRIDVEPWNQSETEQYVESSLARAGASSSVFDEAAVARLQELTHGVPRRVNQLADLALIAGAGQNLNHIDADVVQSVFEELAPA